MNLTVNEAELHTQSSISCFTRLHPFLKTNEMHSSGCSVEEERMGCGDVVFHGIIMWSDRDAGLNQISQGERVPSGSNSLCTQTDTLERLIYKIETCFLKKEVLFILSLYASIFFNCKKKVCIY